MGCADATERDPPVVGAMGGSCSVTTAERVLPVVKATNPPISQSPNPPIHQSSLAPNLWPAPAQRYSRAKMAPRFAPAPLDNQEIAFGCGRLARHPFSHRSVPLWGRCRPRLARGAAAAAGCAPLAARATRPDGAARHPSAATGRGAWSFLPALPAAVPAASAVPCRSRALPLASVPPVALRAKGIFVRRKP